MEFDEFNRVPLYRRIMLMAASIDRVRWPPLYIDANSRSQETPIEQYWRKFSNNFKTWFVLKVILYIYLDATLVFL